MRSGAGFKAADGVYGLTVQIANVYFIENPSAPREIILVDAGMPQSAEMITEEMKRRFKEGYQLKAVILTHYHFDHVGAIEELLELWNVPVYIHEKELPYVTGKRIIRLPRCEKGLSQSCHRCFRAIRSAFRPFRHCLQTVPFRFLKNGNGCIRPHTPYFIIPG